MGIGLSILHTIKEKTPGVWNWLMEREALKPMFSRIVYNLKTNVTDPRPNPYTMKADYVTWSGFVDRSYTARHLPPPAKPLKLPPENDVVDLFMRPRRDPNDAAKA